MSSQKILTYNLSAVEIYKLVLDETLKTFPHYFWDEPDGTKNASEITKYLLEERLKWNDDDIKTNFNINIFRSNKLAGMMKMFDGSPFKALDNVYPKKFKIWELKKSIVPRSYWNKKTIAKATKWLFKEKLKWSIEDIKKHCTIQTFRDGNLYGMLQHHFNYSPYLLLKEVYPNEDWSVLNKHKKIIN